MTCLVILPRAHSVFIALTACKGHPCNAMTSQSAPRSFRATLSTYHCAFTAIMCLTLARRQSSSGASSDLAALPRRPRPRPHFYCVFVKTQSHDAYFVYARSTRRRMAIYATLSRQMKMSLRRSVTVGDCTAACMHPGVLLFFHGRSRIALKTQPRCVRGFNANELKA